MNLFIKKILLRRFYLVIMSTWWIFNFAANANIILREAVQTTGLNVSSWPIPYFCIKPLATNRALKRLSCSLSLTLNTHRDLIAFLLLFISCCSLCWNKFNWCVQNQTAGGFLLDRLESPHCRRLNLSIKYLKLRYQNLILCRTSSWWWRCTTDYFLHVHPTFWTFIQCH